jgi:hypothetical protein
MLEGMGEDPDRDGLLRTPERVADFYAELTEGMWEDPKEHIVPLPGDTHDEMVLVKDISIASVCEHHLAPFVGKCHIAYIPKGGRIVGLYGRNRSRAYVHDSARGQKTWSGHDNFGCARWISQRSAHSSRGDVADKGIGTILIAHESRK